MNEQELLWVRQAIAGDKQAFGRLVAAYQRPIYNLTYRMLGNPEEAEDAAQETFLRAYSRLEQYNPEHKFSTWLFSIANNHSIDRLRKRRFSKVSIDDNPVLQNLEGSALMPEQSALIREQAVHLQALLDQLEPTYRTPLVLRYWHEQSYDEIATIMGISLSAVKSRLFRARQKMAHLYAEAEATRLLPPSARRQQELPQEKAVHQTLPFRMSLLGLPA